MTAADLNPFLAPIGAVVAVASLGYLLVLALRRVGPPQARGDTAVRRRFTRNSLTPIAANLADRAVFWAFWIVALRLLGPEGNGEYAFAANLLTYFAALVDFGLGTLVTRDVARRGEDLHRVFGQTLALRLRLLVVALPMMVGVALIYWVTGSISERTLLVTAILAIGLIPSAINQAYASVYGAWERMDRRALVVVGTSGLTAALGLLLLGLGLGVLGIALAGALSSLATFGALARPVGFNLLRGHAHATASELRDLAGAALPLMLNSLLATAFIQIDVLILQPLQGTAVVGHYNAAYKFINALNILPAAIVLAAFPLMARAAGDTAELARWFARTWRVLATLAAAAVVLFFVFANDIIGTLLGPDFLPESGVALAILIWFLPLSYLNGTLQYVLIAQDRQWWLTPAFVVTTLFNIALNLALVPAFGFRAAAATTVASEALLLAIFAWVIRRDGLLREIAKPVVRPLAAAAVFALVTWALRDAYWMVAAVAGLAAFTAMLLATGGLRPAQLRDFGAALTQRPAAD